MISKQHRCIFIHIPKTAGTSIEKKLGHFEVLERDSQDHRTFREIEPFAWHQLGSLLDRKDPYLAKKWRNSLKGMPHPSPREFHDFYKFSIVRNPWARAYSWYRNVIRDDFHLKSLGIDKDCTLSDFLRRLPDQWALRPQLFWLRDSKGGISLDFIGKFENLGEDFGIVAEKLGLSDPELPHLIKGDRATYVDAFDDDSRERVRQRYAEEIDLFGYRFGD
jgi:hypothetical protein